MNGFLTKYNSTLKIDERQKREVTVPLETIEKLAYEVLQGKSPQDLFGSIERIVERPIEECLKWLGDLWLMVAEKLNKEVEPIVWEASMPVFAEPYKNLFATLVHAVRNSADHGIESAKEREAARKPRKGRLYFKFELWGDDYHLRIRDDGRGTTPEQLKLRAHALGIPIPAKEEDTLDLLYEESFTTRSSTTEFSGRGVGLSALRLEA